MIVFGGAGSFPEAGLLEAISTRQVEELVSEVAFCFLMSAVMTAEQERDLQVIPVVREFPEVLPDDVPEVSPKGM